VVNFKIIELELLSEKSQLMLVAQQMALPEEMCDLLEIVKAEHYFLDKIFMGNPKHLIAICDWKMGYANLQIFELLNSLVHEMIKKVLVKMDNIGENENNLAGLVRQSRELLVVSNAHMLKLDFLDLNLSSEKEKHVNNIGILNVANNVCKPNSLFALFSHFLVSMYLIHKFKIEEIKADNFGKQLTDSYPNIDFTIALKLLENYMTTNADSLPDDLCYSLDLKNII
jgi:hypothetical protein